MDVLARLNTRVVALSSFWVAVSTIFLCYGLAVGLGHVPAWLPMISDCAVQAPEKYPFRIGMISAALLLALNTVLMKGYMLTVKAGCCSTKADGVGTTLALVACAGLAIVGAVNEQEDNPVHGASAVVFFFGYEAYMWIIAIRFWTMPAQLRNEKHTVSTVVKSIICVVSSVMLALFVFFSTHWGRYHIQIAVCEWSGVGCILLFNLSNVWEYRNTFKLESLLTTPPAATRADGSRQSQAQPQQQQQQQPVVLYMPVYQGEQAFSKF